MLLRSRQAQPKKKGDLENSVPQTHSRSHTQPQRVGDRFGKCGAQQAQDVVVVRRQAAEFCHACYDDVVGGDARHEFGMSR